MVGQFLFGFCNGYFGRDSYGRKRIEAEGADWVVVRDVNGSPCFTSFASTDTKRQLLEEWSDSENAWFETGERNG